MQKTQKQEFLPALQKAYSTLSQVTQQIIAENGSPKADENGESRLSDNESLYNMFKNYLSSVKDCGSGTGCFNQLQTGMDGYKYLGSKNLQGGSWNTGSGYRKIILSDGMLNLETECKALAAE